MIGPLHACMRAAHGARSIRSTPTTNSKDRSALLQAAWIDQLQLHRTTRPRRQSRQEANLLRSINVRGHHRRQVLHQQHIGISFLYIADNYLHRQTSSTTTTPSSSTATEPPELQSIFFILHNLLFANFSSTSATNGGKSALRTDRSEISSASSSGSGSQGSWWSLS